MQNQQRSEISELCDLFEATARRRKVKSSRGRGNAESGFYEVAVWGHDIQLQDTTGLDMHHPDFLDVFNEWGHHHGYEMAKRNRPEPKLSDFKNIAALAKKLKLTKKVKQSLKWGYEDGSN